MSSITFKELDTIRVNIGQESETIVVIAKPEQDGDFEMIYHLVSDSCFFQTEAGKSKTLTVKAKSPQPNHEYDTSFTIVGDIDEAHFARIYIELDDTDNPQSPRRPITIKP